MRTAVLRGATLVAIATSLAGCGEVARSVSDRAAPIVDRLAGSPSPQRWDFFYQPDSASPYADCLSGVDTVSGSVDRATGLVRLTPGRQAPPLIVTDSALLIGETIEPESWLEVPLGAGAGELPVVDLFGEALASYVAAGIEATDPKTTVEAAIDIATSVDVAPAPFGLAGDAIEITIDPDLYIEQLAAGGIAITEEERNRIPTITGVVDTQGRVTGLVVDPGASGDSAPDVEHRDLYVVTALYDDLEPLVVPIESSRTVIGIENVRYPSPDQSCAFGS